MLINLNENIGNNYYFQLSNLSVAENKKTEPQDTTSQVVFGEKRQILSPQSADTIGEIIRYKKKRKKHKKQENQKKINTEETQKTITNNLDTIPKTDTTATKSYSKEVFYNPEIKLKQQVFFKKYEYNPNTIKIVKPKIKVNKVLKTIETIKIKNVNETKLDLKTYKTDYWIIGIIILSVLLFSLLRLAVNKNYKILLKSGYNYNYAIKLFKENNTVSDRVNFLFGVIFYVNISLFLYIFFKYSNFIANISNFQLFILTVFGVVLIYPAKYLLIRILGYIFELSNVAKEYILSISLYNKLLGISLFPIIITLPFISPIGKPIFIYLGFFLIVIFFIFRIIRGFQIVFKIKLSIIYWILYLCTLEILPIIIISKILNG